MVQVVDTSIAIMDGVWLTFDKKAQRKLAAEKVSRIPSDNC